MYPYPIKGSNTHGKERRVRGTGRCATRRWIERLRPNLIFQAKQEGRSTSRSNFADGEERGRTGESARWGFCSRNSCRGTRIVFEVLHLPTADVGSPPCFLLGKV